MKINKIDIEKLKTLKAGFDFYRSIKNELYDQAEEIAGGSELFHHWFKNDINTLEEVLEDYDIEGESVSLMKIENYEDGTASYVFSVTDEYRSMVGDEMGISNVTDEDLKLYIENNIKEADETK